jgi:Rod binding domain-containing protein
MADAIALPGAPLPMRTAGFQPAEGHGRQDAGGTEELRRAAEEFEAIFLAQMMAPMFEGLDTDGLGGGGMGEEIFRPMLIERYAEALSQAGGVGVADSIVRELMRLQEITPLPEAADGAAR